MTSHHMLGRNWKFSGDLTGRVKHRNGKHIDWLSLDRVITQKIGAEPNYMICWITENQFMPFSSDLVSFLFSFSKYKGHGLAKKKSSRSLTDRPNRCSFA